jgi:hypothetical protein
MRWSIVAAVLLLANITRADERWDVGASLGYAAPVGFAQGGDAMSDTASALVPFSLDASYRATKQVGAGASLTYGIGVPTLCATESDCVASLGRDVSLALRARFFLPHFLRIEPTVDVGPGWEWLSTKLVDGAAESSRFHSGPVFLMEASAPLRLGRHTALGPVLGATGGTFTTSRLGTPAFTRDDSGGHSLHGWLSASLRCAISF